MDIPVAFGTVELNALDSIKDLPPLLAKRLSTELPFLNEYVCVWTDTLDYGFGIGDIAHGAHIVPRNDFAFQLLRSGDRELRACVELLTHGRVPNSNAAQSARMATEVFLKAYLVINEGRDETYLKKNFSHDLGKLLLSCLNWKYLREFDFLTSRINCFSPVSARYQGTTYPSEMLWLNYSTALLTAVTVVRSLSGRDTRPRMKPNP